VVVEVDNVSLAFDTPVLEDVSFHALDGETVAIVGESGTGKSTILKLILRLLVPDRGRSASTAKTSHRSRSTRRSWCGRKWEWSFRAPPSSTR
jgi:ABC-type Mn2+/Zn2+ transport system ATPase subunit